MTTRTHVLISEPFNIGYSIVGSTNSRQPPNRVDWPAMYDELTWTLTLRGITDGGQPGAPANTLPSAWTLACRFQYRQMHTGDTARFQKPRWWNLTEREVATHCVEGVPLYGPGQPEPVADPITGVGNGIIATHLTAGYQASGADVAGLFTNPIRVSRTFRHFPMGMRLVISQTDSSFTGGTTPRFLLGLEVVGKRNGESS